MLEKITYINHLNEVVEFGNGEIFANYNDLRNYDWSVISKNNKISGFKKGIVKKTLPIKIKAKTEEEGIKLKNRLFEVFEKDVLSKKHGKFIIGDYYLKCYVTGASKSEYLLSKSYLTIKVTIYTDYPYWVRETTTQFNYGKTVMGGTNLDFNRDFPSDYTSNMLGKTLDSVSFAECNFKMVIYGVTENPEITIAGHKYAVNTSIAANEYLTIDSINKTIVKTLADGTTANCFNQRNRESYIFEKIPAGQSMVSSSTDFKFDVTLLDERSEPKWI